jgi:hypothetical protein
MEREALWIVATIGVGTLGGVFYRMKNGFGPFNLKVVGIVLIAILAVILGVTKEANYAAAMGILGAIAGYLFGAKSGDDNSSQANASNSQFGDNAKVAGRDINETVNNINTKIDELTEQMAADGIKIGQFIASQELQSKPPQDYLINTLYHPELDQLGEEMQAVIEKWQGEGWEFLSLSSDFHGMDGMFLLFQRHSTNISSRISVYHGEKSDLRYRGNN